VPDLKPIACAMPDGRIAVYIGSDYKYLPPEKAMELVAQICGAIADTDASPHAFDHAVHAYKVGCVARMAMEVDPSTGEPTAHALDASIRVGLRAALCAYQGAAVHG